MNLPPLGFACTCVTGSCGKEASAAALKSAEVVVEAAKVGQKNYVYNI